MMYFASDCNSSEFETIVNILARRKGIGNIKRVQFIGDGAMWIQKYGNTHLKIVEPFEH